MVAKTPLIEGALEGPVILRSSSHKLPDMVLSLHGPALPADPIRSGRAHRLRQGRDRSSFEAIPDAPISEVRLQMEGGQKGLIVNSTNLCQGKHRATVNLGAHNGRSDTLHPALQSKCKKKGKRRKK